MPIRSGPRLLIAAGAAAATSADVPPLIGSLIRDASDVLLITPASTSELHVWTDDFDHARHEADERLATIFGQLETIAPDSPVHAATRSDVPLTALDDAVRTFQPDQILIALRAADRAAWQEEHLVERAKQRFQIPITVFELDRADHGRPAAAVRAGTQHGLSLYRRASRGALRPIRKVEAETHHLHEVERAGESGETPFIVILSVFLFLLPIFGLILTLAFTAYYVFG